MWENPLRTAGEPRARAHPGTERGASDATAGELMQFLQAINWMRTSLPKLAEFEAPMWTMLEEFVFRQVACTIGGVTRGACFV